MMSVVLGEKMGYLIGIGLALLLSLIGIGYYIYTTRRGLVHHYDVVQHQLDDEEIEFKKMIELQGDDLEEMFGVNEEDVDVAFDIKDRNRLDMLEQYRSNLVAGESV